MGFFSSLFGGGKKTTKTKQTTEIPAEIRERGTKISTGAMNTYMDPAQRYTSFSYNNPNSGPSYTSYNAAAPSQAQFNPMNSYGQASSGQSYGTNSTTNSIPPGGNPGYGSGGNTGAFSYAGNPPTGPGAGNYDWSGVGQSLTGQLNSYHDQAGSNIYSANQQYDKAGQSYQPYLDAAGMTAQDAYQNNMVSGPDYSTENLQKFMNPYQDLVIDQGIRKFGDAMTQQRLSDQSRAGLAGAFGGARHGVLDNLNYASSMQNMSDFIGNQLYQGYGNAQNQYNTDFGQQLQAAAQNYNQGMGYSSQLQNLGQQQQSQDIAAGDAQLKASQAAQQLGNIYTAQDEAQKQNAYNYGYKDARDYPMQVYKDLAGINAMQPHNTTTTGTQTQPSQGWLGTALNVAGTAASFLSDEAAKENIVERNPEAVLTAFSKIKPKSYTYKTEVSEAYPDKAPAGDRDGWIQQDYDKAFGRKPKEAAGGYRGFDVANVLGDLAAAVHGLEKRTRKLK